MSTLQTRQAVVVGRSEQRRGVATARIGWHRVALRLSELAVDGGLICLSFWLAYLMRYRFELGGAVNPGDERPFATFEARALVFAGLGLLILWVRGIYRMPRTSGLLDEAIVVFGGLTTAMAGVVLTAFLTRFLPSRLVFVYAWAIAIALIVLRRWLTRRGRAWLWVRNHFVERVLVVGAGESGRRLMQAMIGMPNLGYRLVGYVDDAVATNAMPVATERRFLRAPRLGTTADVEQVVAYYDIDEVIVALPAGQQERSLAIIDHCRQRSVRFKVVPDLLQLSLDRVDLSEVAGLPLIGVKSASIRGANYALKRLTDIASSIAVLLLAALPMAVIALRIGRDGVPFTMLKFRCMVVDAETRRAELLARHDTMDPRLFKLADDPRLTRAGRRVRRWSLDELPQFVNVLRGDMSLVGPRPQIPEEVMHYAEWHKQRLMVTPGLTGLWQVGGRSNLTFDEMVRLDLFYAEHWSPWLDAKIVLRTIPAVLTRRGAH